MLQSFCFRHALFKKKFNCAQGIPPAIFRVAFELFENLQLGAASRLQPTPELWSHGEARGRYLLHSTGTRFLPNRSHTARVRVFRGRRGGDRARRRLA